MNIILDVIEFKILNDFEILLKFENNEVKKISLQHLLNEKPFSALQNKNIFNLAYIENGTICWPQDIDIAPEYLYNNSFSTDSEI